MLHLDNALAHNEALFSGEENYLSVFSKVKSVLKITHVQSVEWLKVKAADLPLRR